MAKATTLKVQNVGEISKNGKAQAPKKKDQPCMFIGEYNGKPMIIFGDDPAARFAFQFQAGKAQKILDAIEVHGVEEFVNALKTVCAG